MYFVLNRERSNTKSANGSVLNRSRFNTKALLYYIQYTVHWEVHEDDAMALPLDMGRATSRNTTKWFSVLFSGAEIHAQARTKTPIYRPLRKPYLD